MVPASLLPGAKEPQVAVSDSGNVYVAFGVKDALYLCASHDAGASYEPPVKIDDAPNLMLGMRRGPRIAVAGGPIVVSAISNGNLLAWKSDTEGKSWIGPERVNDSDGSASEGLHAMTSLGTEVACAWLDHRNGHAEIWAAISEDGGENWSDNSLVYKSPDGNVCECCHPSVAITPDGTIHVMFRNSLNGFRDMYVVEGKTDTGYGMWDGGYRMVGPDSGSRFISNPESRIPNLGWSSAKLLGQGHWKLDACPMDGGAISFNDQAHVFTIWRRNDTVFSASPGASEDRRGVGLQPWIYGGQGVYGVYLKKRPGPLLAFHA